MKLNMTREWFERRIAQEGDLEVGAGSPLEEHDVRDEPELKEEQAQGEFAERVAFGSLVQLLRRSKGMSIEQLADAARIDPVEIIGIERNPTHQPRPRTVCQLAEYLGLPKRPLIRLSSLTSARNTKLRNAAIRFAAHSPRVMDLTEEEHSALAEFVAFLSSQDAES